jgi:PAS domain S-box-containing protein
MNVKILNVDDDDGGRYVTTRILRQAGFSVDEATTGSEALRKVALESPYLVLLDVNLPDIHGFEVCRRIKSDPATAAIPVLQMSATYVEGTDRARGLEGGADAYLVEPVEPAELVATINAFIRMRRAEEAARRIAGQWQTIFDAINDGVGLLDLGGTVLRCNRSFAAALGRSVDDICGSVCTDASGGGLDLSVPLQNMAKKGHREIAAFKLGERTVQITVDPTFDSDRRTTGAVCVLADITERVLAEEDLTTQKRHLQEAVEERARLLEQAEQAQQDAELANRLKDEFIATVSHELRTPLNSVLGWTNLLRAGRLDDQAAARALETIERNARLQSKLIDDLLDASRIMSGKLRIDVHPVDISHVVESALEALKPIAAAKEISLQSIVDPEAGVVMGDSNRLHQVIWNLVSNSVKFTSSGGQIQVRLQRHESQICMTVQDNGIGISPDFLPHLFEGFRQADNSTTRSYSGLGLGLAIVRNLVEMHHGTVHALSDGEGSGATFTVTLPALSREETGFPPRTGSDEPPVQLRGLRVLVVDDEDDTRDLLKIALQKYGAQVVVAGSVGAALDALAEFDPAVVVSDIEMPGEDGYALLAEMKKRRLGRGMRIATVALTAYATTEDRELALSSGFDAHVSKPVEPLRLARIIAKLAFRSAGA